MRGSKDLQEKLKPSPEFPESEASRWNSGEGFTQRAGNTGSF